MDKAMSSLCQELFREAQERRVPLSKLARLKRKSDLSVIIPLLIREIEVHIKRNMKGEEERRVALISLNIRRSQFLEFQKEAIYKGK